MDHLMYVQKLYLIVNGQRNNIERLKAYKSEKLVVIHQSVIRKKLIYQKRK